VTSSDAYLDTNIVSAIVRYDLPSILFSLGIMFAHYRIGDLRLLTSQAMKTELDKIDANDRGPYLAIYQSLGQVPYLAPARPGQRSYIYGGRRGFVQGGIIDEPDFASLRQILGLGNKHWPDAEHLFEAITAGVQYFVTADYNSILKHRTKVESGFPIRLRDPSEFVTEMSW
jgi:hypothetical protein